MLGHVIENREVVSPSLVPGALDVLGQADVWDVLRAPGLTLQREAHLAERLVALLSVAAAAAANKVIPTGRPAKTLRDDVIDGQFLGCVSAVLAGVIVTGEYAPARETQFRERSPDVSAKSDDGRRIERTGYRVDYLVVRVQHIYLSQEDHRHRPSEVTDVQGLIIAV